MHLPTVQRLLRYLYNYSDEDLLSGASLIGLSWGVRDTLVIPYLDLENARDRILQLALTCTSAKSAQSPWSEVVDESQNDRRRKFLLF